MILGLIKIIQKEWGILNPSQKVAILNKIYTLKPSVNNKKILEAEKEKYKKWQNSIQHEKYMSNIKVNYE